MADRGVRNLSNLAATASSARVLNLIRIAEKHEQDPSYRERPLFHNRVLNQSLIIKHRLRRNDIDLFAKVRTSATKILVPIDRHDLGRGGQYIFVGQKHYAEMLQEYFGDDLTARSEDYAVLEAIDQLPTLDPFILREHLASKGIKPSGVYFDLSEAELNDMMGFVKQDISPLIDITFGDLGDNQSYADVLVNKILASERENQLEPLRNTLHLDDQQYAQGVFCWKGFLYYKWLIQRLRQRSMTVATEIVEARLMGPCDTERRTEVKALQKKLSEDGVSVFFAIHQSLTVYDNAFKALTQARNPVAFRDFLLSSPGLFFELGERMAAVQHMASYWRFRFPKEGRQMVDAEELYEILIDFDAGLPSLDYSAPVAA